MIDFAESAFESSNRNYLVFLILTDGYIYDMQLCIDQIVRGSKLPLSLIVIGIGEGDFT